MRKLLLGLVLLTSMSSFANEKDFDINQKPVDRMEFFSVSRSELDAHTLCERIREHVNGFNVVGLTVSTTLSNDHLPDPLSPRHLDPATRCSSVVSYSGNEYSLLELNVKIKLSEEVSEDYESAQDECYRKKDEMLDEYSYALISDTDIYRGGFLSLGKYECKVRASVLD